MKPKVTPFERFATRARKRLERQGLLADAKAGENSIRPKAKELMAVQADLQQALLEYRPRGRAVLTSDQPGRRCAGPRRRRGGGSGSWFEP